ncbi:hypothetical protein ABZ357_10835 [Streptomyces sp. NPDC005917]|uniref:hypothetical protein n=1 Tax=unclassified Streptomyces TaxID=2593676 RepID=UPI0033C7583A
MTTNIAALSALRTLESTTVTPRDPYERMAVLGAFKALYRLTHQGAPTGATADHSISGNGDATQSG